MIATMRPVVPCSRRWLKNSAASPHRAAVGRFDVVRIDARRLQLNVDCHPQVDVRLLAHVATHDRRLARKRRRERCRHLLANLERFDADTRADGDDNIARPKLFQRVGRHARHHAAPSRVDRRYVMAVLRRHQDWHTIGRANRQVRRRVARHHRVGFAAHFEVLRVVDRQHIAAMHLMHATLDGVSAKPRSV